MTTLALESSKFLCAWPCHDARLPWEACPMDQRLSLITLAVADVEASRRFYLAGLGWAAEIHVPGEVLMIRTGQHLLLSLWDAREFEAEAGPIAASPGLAPSTSAHNVGRPGGVDQVLATARDAGAAPAQDVVRRERAGHSGY